MHKPRSAWVRFVQGYNDFMNSGFFQSFLNDYAHMLGCPDPLQLEDDRLGLLSEPESQALQAHLAGCAACREQLARLTQSAPLPSTKATEIPAVTPFTAPTAAASASLAPGQIWSTRAELDLQAHALPAAQTVRAGFLRLFVVTGLGPLHAGRFQEVRLCPVTELTELAGDKDLLLEPGDSSLAEELMIETWNLSSALALHLQSRVGELSPEALAQLRLMLRDQPFSAKRGGQIISPDGAHARFQVLEREQAAYLAQPLQAVVRLMQLARPYLLKVTPKGLQGSPPTAPHPLFAQRQGQAPDRILAASAGETPTVQEPQAWRESLALAPDCLLELWIEGPNLEFYAHTSEQQPLIGLELSYPDAQGQLQTLDTDSFGTAFVPLAEVAAGEILLSAKLPDSGALRWLTLQLRS